MRFCKYFFIGIICILYSAAYLEAGVIEEKTITRDRDPIVLKGSNIPNFIGLGVNSTDPTQLPNQIFVWAYDSGTGWRPVIFQIDEVNNTYPNLPGPDYYICNTTTWQSRGGYGLNYFEADDSLLDSNDEIAFMAVELGDRVTLDEWAPGASTTQNRYEITVEDPLYPGQKGWIYLFRHDTIPPWTTGYYAQWNETENTLTANSYQVDYPNDDTLTSYFTTLSVDPTYGGTGTNLVVRQRWNSRFYFSSPFSTNVQRLETQMRTQFHLGGYSNNTEGDAPWKYKTGPVRIHRYYWTNPVEAAFYTGDHPWKPRHRITYYATFWHEDINAYHSCPTCAAELIWYRDYIDHNNTVTFTHYTSNNETSIINGSPETLAVTPMWTWDQVSSTEGGYVKIFPSTYIDVDPDGVKQNYYLDNGTTDGETGYYIYHPAKTTNTSHHFYYFVLPANAPNVGEEYLDIINSPVTTTSSSQTYSMPPDFSGIESAIDVNGACVEEGVMISWTSVIAWNDGCTSNCDNRHYQVERNGVTLYNEFNETASSYIDLTGINCQMYDYGMEACNENNDCTDLGTTVSASDYVSTAPSLSNTSTIVADNDPCSGDGILISWAPVQSWNDNGEGAPHYDLYWDDDNYMVPIAVNITSPYLFDAEDEVSHSYRIRAFNGCGNWINYSTSSAVADQLASAPTGPASPLLTILDLSDCSLSGIQIAWDPVISWNDNGYGERHYDLFWDDDGFTTPIAVNITSPVIYEPGDNLSHVYRMVAINGCSNTFVYTDTPGIDSVDGGPNFSGLQNISDNNLCDASVLTLNWIDIDGDGATGWNDGGSGPGTRHYRILRDGVEIANSPMPDGSTSTTDQPPLTGVGYLYTVQAWNMDLCYTNAGVVLTGTDLKSSVPVASPAQTTGSDECDRDEDPQQGILLSWDPIINWGDNGANISQRRYLIYWSVNNYSSPIASLLATQTSYNFNPPDNMPIRYLVIARSGCNVTLAYSVSALVNDKTSCAPPCTLIIEDTFDPTNHFSESCDGGTDLWTLTPGVGNNNTTAWKFELDDGANTANLSAALELNAVIPPLPGFTWTEDVKLRFWSSGDLNIDDAGVIEIWTDDSGLWKKVENVNYPAPYAEVPNSVDLSCPSNISGGTQPAFQGSFSGYYEARLDYYMTTATTQISLRFKAASGAINGSSTWIVDDVLIGYGITDPVYYWSKMWDFNLGVVKNGNIVEFSWDDDGLYITDEFRIYRSLNPAAIRTDASSEMVHAEPDVNALYYTWSDPACPDTPGVCCYFKIYGYKQPCGESNEGEN